MIIQPSDGSIILRNQELILPDDVSSGDGSLLPGYPPTLKEIAYLKLLNDLKFSALDCPMLQSEKFDTSTSQLSCITSPDTLQNTSKALSILNLRYDSWWGRENKNEIGRLREKYCGKVTVDCMATLIGCHVVLNEMRIKNLLEVSCPLSMSGRDQMESIENKSYNTDVLIAPDAPVYLFNRGKTQIFERYCVVHTVRQSLLVKGNLDPNKESTLFVYDKSSVELQMHISKSAPHGQRSLSPFAGKDFQ